MIVAKHMTEMTVFETSGVDFPAHLDNGWLVVKQEGAEMSEENTEAQEVEVEAPEVEAAEPATAEEFLASAPDVVKARFEQLEKSLADATEMVQKEKDAREQREAEDFVASVENLNLDAALVKDLRAAGFGDRIEPVFKEMNGKAESAKMFEELGTAGTPEEGSLEQLAKALVDSGDAPNINQATDMVLNERPELYKRS